MTDDRGPILRLRMGNPMLHSGQGTGDRLKTRL